MYFASCWLLSIVSTVTYVQIQYSTPGRSSALRSPNLIKLKVKLMVITARSLRRGVASNQFVKRSLSAKLNCLPLAAGSCLRK